MSETPSHSPPQRRRADDPASASRRIGVVWRADARTARHKIWSTVFDISPDGAQLGIDITLLGQVKRFQLAVDALPAIECAPVWQHDGRLGVRFVGGQPSMSQLRDLLARPPYQFAPV